MRLVDLDCLVGQEIVKIKRATEPDSLTFYCKSGDVFLMYHEQDCCEDVFLESVDEEELKAILHSEVVLAEEATQSSSEDYGTWTFYTIMTKKSCLSIRWYGESNGYYSEEVDFRLLKER